MDAVTVCVDYGDILTVTLPVNAPHFRRWMIVTSPDDTETIAFVRRMASLGNLMLHITDEFTRDGAVFNKGRALNTGLDLLNPEGWFVILDADIVLPECINWPELQIGNLYCPRRRMLRNPRRFTWDMPWHGLPPGPEQTNGEHAGYFQLANATDPVLQAWPRYPINWRHAGGCDSFYHMKWKHENKKWLDFEVLHLGQDGVNWCGRSTERMDGGLAPEATERRASLDRFISGRIQTRSYRGEQIEGLEESTKERR